MPPTIPQRVAAARLRAELARELQVDASQPSTEAEQELLKTLETESLRANPEPRDRGELRAWVDHLRLLRRKEALQRLQLEAGDIVKVMDVGGSHVEEVSSIGSDGRVFFRGGAGAGAWPDQLEVCCRKDEHGEKPDELKRQAANSAATRSRLRGWSEASMAELGEFEVTAELTNDDVDLLANVIDEAQDERPIQALIEERPQLLTALLRGKRRFLIAQKRLGDKYIPDFLICDVDSLGIRWVFVELETPRSAITLQRDNQLDEHARKGASQIVDWREWCLGNLSYARAPRTNNGLGLVDVRPGSEGIVLVGRRALLRENSTTARHALREKERIQVHTYDWLLEALRAALQIRLPAANPYLL